MMPQRQEGMVRKRTCGMVMSKPDMFEMPTKATTAAAMGGADDADLARDGGDGAGALRADVLLYRDVDDDGHQRVDDMPGSDEHREEEGAERGEEHYPARVAPQEALRELDEPVHAARCLQYARAGHGGDDDVDDLGRRRSGLHAETEHQNGKSDARYGAEGEAPEPRSDVERQEHDEELDDHDENSHRLTR